jgi:type II secretory pathway component GspD/PulD (secretin)
VIGELFKHRNTQRDFQEILFFLTPRIVRQDGGLGPRAPQRSSVEGPIPAPAGPADQKSVTSSTQSSAPQQAVSAKGGQ